MTVYTTDRSVEAIAETFRQAVHFQKAPTGFRFAPALKQELCGSVEDGSFWVVKNTPHFSRLPQRVFKGSIVSDGRATTIRGKFVFPKDYLIVTLSLIAAILLIIAVLLISNRLSFWLGAFLLLCVCFYLCSFPLGVLRFRKQERDVLDFLAGLAAADRGN